MITYLETSESQRLNGNSNDPGPEFRDPALPIGKNKIACRLTSFDDNFLINMILNTNLM